MEGLNGWGKRFLLVWAVAAIVSGGRIARGDFVFGAPSNLGPAGNSSDRDEEPGILEVHPLTFGIPVILLGPI